MKLKKKPNLMKFASSSLNIKRDKSICTQLGRKKLREKFKELNRRIRPSSKLVRNVTNRSRPCTNFSA